MLRAIKSRDSRAFSRKGRARPKLGEDPKSKGKVGTVGPGLKACRDEAYARFEEAYARFNRCRSCSSLEKLSASVDANADRLTIRKLDTNITNAY